MPTSAPGNRGTLGSSAEHGFTPAGRSAEHGFTPAWRSAEDGFTLVELMVVLVVIGLASAVAVMAIPDPRGRLVDEASRFAGRVRAAHDQAIVGARPVSLWVSAGGYGFDERRQGAWVPVSEQPLTVARWNDGTVAGVGGERDRVTFDETGLADRALVVPLQRGTTRVSVTIAGDGSVRVAG